MEPPHSVVWKHLHIPEGVEIGELHHIMHRCTFCLLWDGLWFYPSHQETLPRNFWGADRVWALKGEHSPLLFVPNPHVRLRPNVRPGIHSIPNISVSEANSHQPFLSREWLLKWRCHSVEIREHSKQCFVSEKTDNILESIFINLFHFFLTIIQLVEEIGIISSILWIRYLRSRDT